jgi:hypothetical protein
MLVGTSITEIDGHKKLITKNFTLQSLGQFMSANFPDVGITLTTIGTSGPATLIGDILNIPDYNAGYVAPTLQSVTDAGNTTTNDVVVDSALYESIISNSYISTNTKGAPTGVGLLSSGVISFGNGSAYSYLSSNAANLNVYFNLPNKPSGTYTIATTADIPSAVTSVGLTMPSAFSVTNSPITSSGDIAVTGAGVVSQYVRGDGSLANFPTSTGGGASLSFYLNGSVSQGTIGGVAFREMDRTPILGAGTDFTINANGYIQSFITDANVPNLLEIPAGNWNFETYFSASSGGGSPSFYVELYKWNGVTLSLIASNSANPEGITNGTAIDLYVSALAVPQTTLLATDRLAVRIYVTHSGRTITLHTENSHLCQVITTFSTGLTALNGLTTQVQSFATGTSGTDFAISSATSTHTFNLPTASAANRGALSSTDWTAFNNKFTLPALTSGSVLFSNGTTIAQDNANLFWNDTNNRLGIGTATPGVALDVVGSIRSSNQFANAVGLNLSTVSNRAQLYQAQGVSLSYFNGAVIDGLVLLNTGNVGINTTTDAGYRLDVNGTARIQNNFFISSGFAVASLGNNLNFRSNLIGGSGYVVNAQSYNTLNSTSNEQGFGHFTGIYAPTSVSGTPSFNALKLTPTINQTGGANGITRGLFIDPTLTAAADFRAIETTAGNVLFGASGTGMFWDNTNNRLGIGTATPLYKLQLETSTNGTNGIWARNTNTGTGAFGAIECASLVGSISLRAHSSTHSPWANTSMINSVSAFSGGMVLFQGGANPISFWTNSSERLRIHGTTGNVLINTTTDAGYKLDVNGTARVKAQGALSTDIALRVRNSADTTDLLSIAGNGNSVINGSLRIVSLPSVGNVIRPDEVGVAFQFGNGSNTSYGEFRFRNAGGTDLARLSSTGNLGIGTATPAKKLDVVGSIRTNDQIESSKVLNSVTISNTPADASLLLYAPTTADNYGGIIGWYEGNVAASISAYDAGSGGALGLSLATGNNTSISERMRITNTGNVGIGTTSPAETLEISSTGNTGFSIKRDATSNAARFFLKTSGTYNWSVGIRATRNDFSIFNETSVEALTINATTNNVLINTTTDVASSKLTVESTTQGFLPPRMTTTQKNAIATPAAGLVVYDTTLGKLCVRGAAAWETITSI